MTGALRVGVLTVSDRSAAGAYEDRGGPAAVAFLQSALGDGAEPVRRLVPDERPAIEAALLELCDRAGCHRWSPPAAPAPPPATSRRRRRWRCASARCPASARRCGGRHRGASRPRCSPGRPRASGARRRSSTCPAARPRSQSASRPSCRPSPVTALLITPAATASLLTTRLVLMMALSVGVGLASGIVGLLVSFHAGGSSGATIVLTASAVFAVAWCAATAAGRRRWGPSHPSHLAP